MIIIISFYHKIICFVSSSGLLLHLKMFIKSFKVKGEMFAKVTEIELSKSHRGHT